MGPDPKNAKKRNTTLINSIIVYELNSSIFTFHISTFSFRLRLVCLLLWPIPLPPVFAPACVSLHRGLIRPAERSRPEEIPGSGKEVTSIGAYELLSLVLSLTSLVIAAICLGLSLGQRDRD